VSGITISGGGPLLAHLRSMASACGAPGRAELYDAAGHYMVMTEVPMNFRQQGPGWLPLKSRKGKILQDTGHLRDSISYKVQPSNLLIGTEVVYGRIHNRGGWAGRGRKTFIPKRTYLWWSDRALTNIKKLWLRMVTQK
jgi:phage gpG-like protein